METTAKQATYTSSAEVIGQLKEKLKEDPQLRDYLLESLNQANITAQKELDAKLYKALDWPTDEAGYLKYLTDFSTYIPQQSMDPAWTDPGTDEQQEVYDRLCHFYYLIDQPVGPDDKIIVQNIEWFSDWLITYADLWGSFLNTTDSFNDEILNSFKYDSPKYRVQDSLIGGTLDGRPNSPSGWLTFNQFFARELNPGLRPVASPGDNTVVTCPADCTFKAQYGIDANSAIPEITIKKTHKYANIADLLEGSKYKDAFANGTFVHYFLGPYSYHRFHTPVSGVMEECYPVKGKVYLNVNITDNQFDAPDGSEDAYEFTQARGVVTMDTTNSPFGNVGIVAIIPIGMAQVSSVNMTATTGKTYLKGDEFGYFLFGGSDIIVLFQEGVNPLIDTNLNYRLYGTQIARCTTLY